MTGQTPNDISFIAGREALWRGLCYSMFEYKSEHRTCATQMVLRVYMREEKSGRRRKTESDSPVVEL
jgi:hypothetical protein